MRILLVTPPYHTGIIEITGKWPPLSLVYLAGHLRAAGHKVEIYDAMTKNHSIDEVRLKVLEETPDILMTGAYTPTINCALDVLSKVKKDNPQVITCLGGVHPSFCYDDILNKGHSFVDYIVRGEGEITSVELANTLGAGGDCARVSGLAFFRDGEITVTPDREFLTDLDELVPAWDLLEWEDYYFKITGRRLAVIGSSRGCDHKCKFCSQHLFWKGAYRERSAESFVAEIEHLHKTYSVGMFMLADEYATKNRTRWEQILDLLIKKGLDIHFSLETRVDDILRDEDIIHKYRTAGVIHIYVGVESVDQEVLEGYEKGVTVENSRKALDILNNAGIITECSFIMGGPAETAASMDRTLETAINFNPDMAHFLLITPWPYAKIYNELEPYIVEKDYSKYHFVYPVVKPKAMETREVWDKLINSFRVFYLNKFKQYTGASESLKKQYMLKAIEIMHKEFFTINFGERTIATPEGLEPGLRAAHGVIQKGDEIMVKPNPIDKELLDRKIMDFINRSLEFSDEEAFNELAVQQFVYQYHENDYYRNVCDAQGVTPDSVQHWQDIPALPTQAFKQSIIASFPLSETELSLLTSGTTNPDARGKIYRDKSTLDMIQKCNYMLTKEFVFPDVDRMRILLMVPSPKVAPGMPMAYGLDQARREFGADKSDYYISPRGMDIAGLVAALMEAQEAGEPVCMMGATSGFVFLFNHLKARGLTFKLPAQSRICDGGGYQGTFGECSRDQFYALVDEFLGVPWHMCVNTLGMGESGTNYFDNVLRDHFRGAKGPERYKVDLPWTRTVVVGIRTGKRLPQGELGLIRHYDLTNRATVLAVQTDNIGFETETGFEILGRSVNVPGYDIQTPGGMVKDWILGVGKVETPQVCSTVADGMLKAHGAPCSTVADGMLKAHGAPCSTVADGMLKAHGAPCSTVADGMLKAHGAPCSTVADGMLKAHGAPCSTVADMMLKAQGNPCSTVAEAMLKN